MSDNLTPIQPPVPPKGDEQKGEKYVSDLVRLIDQGKVQINKTDLSQFNPSSLQNHYRVDLDDFQIEISHSSHLESGVNSYVIIFNNLKNIANGNTEKAILAYIHLTENQYRRFYQAAEEQIDKLRKIEDEKKFVEAVRPLDNRLAELESSAKDIFSEKRAEFKHPTHTAQEEDHTENFAPVVEEVENTNSWDFPHASINENSEEEKPAEAYQQQYTLGTQPTTY